MKYTILTPTTGNPHLKSLLVSINALILPSTTSAEVVEIEHVLVVDGNQFREAADSILNEIVPVEHIQRHVIYLPFNTGANNYLGHRIYAGVSHLVNGDYVLFMDEDNTVEPDYILQFYNLWCKFKYSWMYCFRNIIDQEGKHLCRDMCESLGHVAGCFYDRSHHFIDTNCYCVARHVLIQTSYIWHRNGANGEYPDRLFGTYLMDHFPIFSNTTSFAVNYRVGSRPESCEGKMFLTGNHIMEHVPELQFLR